MKLTLRPLNGFNMFNSTHIPERDMLPGKNYHPANQYLRKFYYLIELIYLYPCESYPLIAPILLSISSMKVE